MTDTFNPDELDPGIRQTVLWLRSHGFHTTDSGDGKTKFAAGHDPEALTVPHVVMTTRKQWLTSDADRLAHLLRRDHGVDVGPCSPEGDTPEIVATYNPAEGMGVIVLTNVHDGILRTP